MNAFLKVKDVAVIFKVSQDTVRVWIATGELRAVKSGGTQRIRWRIPESAVNEFAENNSNRKTTKRTAKRKPRPARTIV